MENPSAFGSGAAGSAPSPHYRLGHSLGRPVGVVLCWINRVPIIGPVLAVLLAIPAIMLLVPVSFLASLFVPSGRSAADPDKETPPAGWCSCGTPSTPDVFHRADGPCFHLEPKPSARIGGSICVHCLHPIPDGETVWMHAPTGEVWHVRCRDRYVKERRTTLWEG